MAIGLFGGSFNPPHQGHRLVAETALKRLGLDRVWWIVSPGNPLKDHGALKPLGVRLDAVRQQMAGAAPCGDSVRGRPSHPLYGRHAGALEAPPPLRAFRLDHGRRQPCDLSPLAGLAFHRAAFPDRHRRSAGCHAFGAVGADGAGVRPLSGARSRGGGARLARSAGLRLSARAAFCGLLDDASRRLTTAVAATVLVPSSGIVTRRLETDTEHCLNKVVLPPFRPAAPARGKGQRTATCG